MSPANGQEAAQAEAHSKAEALTRLMLWCPASGPSVVGQYLLRWAPEWLSCARVKNPPTTEGLASIDILLLEVCTAQELMELLETLPCPVPGPLCIGILETSSEEEVRGLFGAGLDEFVEQGDLKVLRNLLNKWNVCMKEPFSSEPGSIHSPRQLRVHRHQGIKQMLSPLIHDFNNLFSLILNYTQLLQEDLEGEHQCQQDLAEIFEASQQGLKILSDLILFHRGLQETTEFAVELEDYIRDSREEFELLLGVDRRLVLEFSEDAHGIWLTRQSLGRILKGLIQNAGEAMKAGGVLTLRSMSEREAIVGEGLEVEESFGLEESLRQRDDRWLTLEDTGHGFLRKEGHFLSDPYYSTRPRSRGQGMGLSVAHGLLQQLGGELLFYGGAGGSKLLVRFPSTRVEEQESFGH